MGKRLTSSSEGVYADGKIYIDGGTLVSCSSGWMA